MNGNHGHNGHNGLQKLLFQAIPSGKDTDEEHNFAYHTPHNTAHHQFDNGNVNRNSGIDDRPITAHRYDLSNCNESDEWPEFSETRINHMNEWNMTQDYLMNEQIININIHNDTTDIDDGNIESAKNSSNSSGDKNANTNTNKLKNRKLSHAHSHRIKSNRPGLFPAESRFRPRIKNNSKMSRSRRSSSMLNHLVVKYGEMFEKQLQTNQELNQMREQLQNVLTPQTTMNNMDRSFIVLRQQSNDPLLVQPPSHYDQSGSNTNTNTNTNDDDDNDNDNDNKAGPELEPEPEPDPESEPKPELEPEPEPEVDSEPNHKDSNHKSTVSTIVENSNNSNTSNYKQRRSSDASVGQIRINSRKNTATVSKPTTLDRLEEEKSSYLTPSITPAVTPATHNSNNYFLRVRRIIFNHMNAPQEIRLPNDPSISRNANDILMDQHQQNLISPPIPNINGNKSLSDYVTLLIIMISYGISIGIFPFIFKYIMVYGNDDDNIRPWLYGIIVSCQWQIYLLLMIIIFIYNQCSKCFYRITNSRAQLSNVQSFSNNNINIRDINNHNQNKLHCQHAECPIHPDFESNPSLFAIYRYQMNFCQSSIKQEILIIWMNLMMIILILIIIIIINLFYAVLFLINMEFK